MKGEMGVLQKHEIDRLMKKVSRERSSVLKKFLSKVYDLKPDEELYQPFLSALPNVAELRKVLSEGDMRFKVWPTINGIMVKREA